MDDINDRENYRRVTSILYPFSGLKDIDPEIVQKAADRGTKVHKICEGIIDGFGEFGVDEDTKYLVESFKQWWGEGHKVIEMEKRFWDDDKRITGQCDLILETERGLCIVDLKTSYRQSKTWPVQGSAYAMLARKAGYDIKYILFIHLNRQGRYPKVYEYPVDETFFLEVLKVYDYFFENKKAGKK